MVKQSILKSSLLKELYFLGYASCADLSDKTGKSFPFVQRLINEMIDEELIEESGLAPSTGGRRPVMYRLKGQNIYSIAVAMDQMITNISLIDTNNKTVYSLEVECPLSNSDGVLNTLHNNIEDVIRKSNVNRSKIVGVGVGMPGLSISLKARTIRSFQKVKSPLRGT